jgi:hypothetical protein
MGLMRNLKLLATTEMGMTEAGITTMGIYPETMMVRKKMMTLLAALGGLEVLHMVCLAHFEP